jgi:hypothetical protein
MDTNEAGTASYEDRSHCSLTFDVEYGMHPDVDVRCFLNWLEAQMRRRGGLPTFPTFRAVFDFLIHHFGFERAPTNNAKSAYQRTISYNR